MTTKNQPAVQAGKLVLYTDKRGNVELRADIKKNTIWATQAQIALLFDVNSQAITKHLNNIFRTGELKRISTCSKMEQVEIEGGRTIRRTVGYYNLDAIIAVGYRVNSRKATKFRIWATKILHDHLVKGYALNERTLSVTTDKIENLREAIEFIESKSKGGPLKAKLRLSLAKDLMK